MTLHQAKVDKRKYCVENGNVVYCPFKHVSQVFLFKPNERVVLEKFIQYESLYSTIKYTKFHPHPFSKINT